MEKVEKKFVIIGDGYVGKTCVLHAIRKHAFNEQLPNVYDEFYIKKTNNNKEYTIKFVDTAGQEEYETLRKLCYQDTDAFLVCFAIDDKVSFENIETKWLPDVKNYDVPLILVGTKLDLRAERPNCLSKERGKDFQRRIRAIYYVECSAKTGSGIEELEKFIIKFSTEKKSSCVIQ